jgi:Flp pilus assembly protein TadD
MFSFFLRAQLSHKTRLPYPNAIFPLALLCLLSACQPPSPAPPVNDANEGNAGVLNVADAAIAGNDPQMALKVSQAVLANDPKNLQALYHEAAAYYAVGRCQDTIAAYQVALSIDTKSAEAETGIGRCLLKRNAIEAEQAFEAAVADDPHDAAALNDLGIALDLQSKYAAATRPYQQSLLIDPGNLATEVNLGMSLALSGDGADALQYLGPLATGQGATPKIRQDYAAALVAAGRTDEARQVLNVDLPPDDVNRLLAAFASAIAAAQAPVQPAATPAAPPPTTPAMALAPVATSPILPTVTAAPALVPAMPPAAAVNNVGSDEIVR